VLNERGSDLIRNWTVTRDHSGRPFCLCGFMFGTTDRMTRAAASSLSVCTPYGVSQAANHGLGALSAAHEMPFLRRIPFFHLSFSRCSSAPTERRVRTFRANCRWRDRASLLIIEHSPHNCLYRNANLKYFVTTRVSLFRVVLMFILI